MMHYFFISIMTFLGLNFLLVSKTSKMPSVVASTYATPKRFALLAESRSCTLTSKSFRCYKGTTRRRLSQCYHQQHYYSAFVNTLKGGRSNDCNCSSSVIICNQHHGYSNSQKRRCHNSQRQYSTSIPSMANNKEPQPEEKDAIILSDYWNINLNKPKHIMAPMVAQSDLPFRILCRTYNTNICYTQMIHAYNFLQSDLFQRNHLDVYPLCDDSDDDGTGTGTGTSSVGDIKRHKLYMSPSGWNILHGLDWDRFEKECTFLNNQYQQGQYQQQQRYDRFDQDEIRDLIQICRHDYESYLKRCSLDNSCNIDDDNNVDDDDDDNDNDSSLSSLDNFQQYGLYYEGLPLKEKKSADTTPPPAMNQYPVVVQLAGHDPQIVSQAAKAILDLTNNSNTNKNDNCDDSNNNSKYSSYTGQVSGIDINCGCPQAIARKGKYGAFLMESDFEAVRQIIQTLKEELPSNVGVSVKIRIPPEYSTCVGSNKGYGILKQRIVDMMDAGVDLITIHGRTLHENKTKVRHCNWDAIKDARRIVQEYYDSKADGDRNKRIIPIIANGGIENYSDVNQCLDHTRANGVMSSEALLENPGLFMNSEIEQQQQQQQQLSPKEVFDRQIRYCHEYLDLCVLFPPLPGSLGKKGGSFNVIRSHMFKFLYRYLEEHTDLRTLLAEPKKMITIQSARAVVYELERRYASINKSNSTTCTGWSELKSSKMNSSWYRRHRDAIACNKMKIRGAKSDNSTSNMTAEEKKVAIMERIRKLKAQKEEKMKSQQSKHKKEVAAASN